MLLFEVLVIIFSYLTPNNIIEVSAACKLFYCVSRENNFFINKLNDSLKLFKGDR